LLPGGQTGVVYVVYATMLGGFVAGLVTIFSCPAAASLRRRCVGERRPVGLVESV
jgi:hypothetical protein